MLRCKLECHLASQDQTAPTVRLFSEDLTPISQSDSNQGIALAMTSRKSFEASKTADLEKRIYRFRYMCPPGWDRHWPCQLAAVFLCLPYSSTQAARQPAKALSHHGRGFLLPLELKPQLASFPQPPPGDPAASLFQCINYKV